MRSAITATQASGQSEPITLSEAKAHLRVEHSVDDTLITGLISAARIAAEQYTNRKLLLYDVTELHHKIKERKIYLVYPDPSSIEVEIKDELAMYDTFAAGEYTNIPGIHAYIQLRADRAWPSMVAEPDAMRITYQTGFTSSNLPRDIKQALLLMLGDYYENRENRARSYVSTVVFAAESLLDRYRIAPFDMI